MKVWSQRRTGWQEFIQSHSTQSKNTIHGGNKTLRSKSLRWEQLHSPLSHKTKVFEKQQRVHCSVHSAVIHMDNLCGKKTNKATSVVVMEGLEFKGNTYLVPYLCHQVWGTQKKVTFWLWRYFYSSVLPPAVLSSWLWPAGAALGLFWREPVSLPPGIHKILCFRCHQ